MKKVAVLQSNYIPWKGYFDIINDVDLFIFHDDLQYTKGDWRNRNKIVSQKGPKWLTIPVGTNEKRLIVDVKFEDKKWQKSHWDEIKRCYLDAPFFNKYKDFFEDLYLNKKWAYLYEVNRYIIEYISTELLGIKTEFADSRDYITQGVKNEKLISLLKDARAEEYISGPSAKNYIEEDKYLNNGIRVIWKDYDGYPEYKQLNENFYHDVSILDMLFNLGEETPSYIWGWRSNGD